jgi:hypothetical protein
VDLALRVASAVEAWRAPAFPKAKQERSRR